MKATNLDTKPNRLEIYLSEPAEKPLFGEEKTPARALFCKGGMPPAKDNSNDEIISPRS